MIMIKKVEASDHKNVAKHKAAQDERFRQPICTPCAINLQKCNRIRLMIS